MRNNIPLKHRQYIIIDGVYDTNFVTFTYTNQYVRNHKETKLYLHNLDKLEPLEMAKSLCELDNGDVIYKLIIRIT